MLATADIAQFYGTERYHRWSPLFRNMVLTDGAEYVAENGGAHGAYWLMDAIASWQPELRKHADQRLRDMQFWTLTVHEDKSAELVCLADNGEPPAAQQHIEYTDFDLPTIDLWVGPVEEDRKRVIMLPSEY